MLAVFSLFLIPIGGGIPAGVLLARAKGLPWGLTAGLYLASDIVLAFAFEPILRLAFRLGRRVPALIRFGQAYREAQRLLAARYQRTGAGPLSLLAISFGVDPMTGRAAALANGHGFAVGWAFAIAGDLLYYAVVAATTLQLSRWIRYPEATVVVMLMGMLLVPELVRRFRR